MNKIDPGDTFSTVYSATQNFVTTDSQRKLRSVPKLMIIYGSDEPYRLNDADVAHFTAEFDHYAKGLLEWYRRPSGPTHMIGAVTAFADFITRPWVNLDLHRRAVAFMDRSGTMASLDDISQYWLINSTILMHSCESSRTGHRYQNAIGAQVCKLNYIAQRASRNSIRND